MTDAKRRYLQSPIGWIEICGTDSEILAVEFVSRPRPKSEASSHQLLEECARQLEEYFAGCRRGFSLPLRLEGTLFQKLVWHALQQIPYGQTVAYSDLAQRIGREKACRAVGAANHRNPVSIIIPCHRVVGRDGGLVGYGGGLWRKQWLLEHEKRKT